MEALILTCSTGGGHNAAAYAVKEEMEQRGHHVTMLDPYSLAGQYLEKKVGNTYIRTVQKTPRIFGFVYRLGDWYRRLPIHSPVYQLNRAMRHTMERFLSKHSFDVILMTHIYPGEILTYMKNKGYTLPKTIYIATDYTCIPFTEEMNCDYYVTPSPALNKEFIRRGIPSEKLIPAGIPVRRLFQTEITREEAIQKLNLNPDKRYLLLSGGSIGAGKISETIGILTKYMETHPDRHLLVICGNHRQLFEELQKQYGTCENISLLTTTKHMVYYMKACDVFLSKPGGLSSTEAAVAQIPLIHITPIPGCESRNMKFFDSYGMSIAIGNELKRLPSALESIGEEDFVALMKENQRTFIPHGAAAQICNLAERLL